MMQWLEPLSVWDQTTLKWWATTLCNNGMESCTVSIEFMVTMEIELLLLWNEIKVTLYFKLLLLIMRMKLGLITVWYATCIGGYAMLV